MKILQVNVVYDKGSTGKIVRDIHQSLKDYGVDSVVCYGRGTKIKEENIYKTCTETYAHFCKVISMVSGITYGSCLLSTAKLISIIKKEKPDIVHLHCINGNFVNIYSLIKWLKVHNIKTVLTLHAEFMHTGGCAYSKDCNRWSQPGGCTTGKCPRWRAETGSLFYDSTSRMWRKMKDAFDGFNDIQIIGVSDWITNRAAASPILKGHKITTIHNGIDLQNFSPDVKTLDREITKKYGLPDDKKLIIHVTPSFNNPVKGGKYFKELSDSLSEEFQAVVIGSKEKISDKIINIPFVANQVELAALYRKASVMVITSIADNYPTVCIEANCCGTPVVGFDVGGVCEAIGKDIGTVVSPFDVQELKNKVVVWSEQKGKVPIKKLQERLEYCSAHRMVSDYLHLYSKVSKEP